MRRSLKVVAGLMIAPLVFSLGFIGIALGIGAAIINLAAIAIPPDDQDAISRAQAECVAIAQKHRSSMSLVLSNQMNVTSEPERNAFEFIWPASSVSRPINSDSMTDEKNSDDIWCRGNAERRVITFLRVGEDIVLGDLKTDMINNVHVY